LQLFPVQRLQGGLPKTRQRPLLHLIGIGPAADNDAQLGRIVDQGSDQRFHLLAAARVIGLGHFIQPIEHGAKLIVVKDVDLAMISVLERFMPPQEPHDAGIHPRAWVHPSATVHPTASIGPGCSVAAGASIGANAWLVANVCVGFNARVGAGTVLYPNVVVYERCEVGAGCMLHAGVIVGADGFGYHPRPDGRGVMKIPHIGNVVIHDHVEIGANSCIDKGKFGSTVVGAGTKIDNLVQVGHNCHIGRSCILCGESGLAGSVTLGDGVILGGRAAVSDNVSVGSGAKIAGLSGVSSDVPAGAVYMGVPAGPAGEWRRIYAQLRRMGKAHGYSKSE
jgi:UDP-3-O-[3-hydroxymyristoyl] glucosamine N-acyltransferase